MWLVSLGVLVFQNDLGSSLLFFGLFLVMLYVATERPGWLVVGGTMLFAGAFLGYTVVSHVQTRVEGWLNPFGNLDNGSFQLVQGMYGMAWGGLVGTRSRPGQPLPDPAVVVGLHPSVVR